MVTRERTKKVSERTLMRVKKISEMTTPTVRRRVQSIAGRAKTRLLPEGVVLVIRKPESESHAKAIDDVYAHWGLSALVTAGLRLTPARVMNNYMSVFREKPHLIPEIMNAFTAEGLLNRNAQVQLVLVPKETIKKLGAKNAADAMKIIAGKTDPIKALKEQTRTGLPNIRGEALKQAIERGAEGPDITYNVVHVPDAEYGVVSGWPNGFPLDVGLFVKPRHIAKAWLKFGLSGKQMGRSPRIKA